MRTILGKLEIINHHFRARASRQLVCQYYHASVVRRECNFNDHAQLEVHSRIPQRIRLRGDGEVKLEYKKGLTILLFKGTYNCSHSLSLSTVNIPTHNNQVFDHIVPSANLANWQRIHVQTCTMVAVRTVLGLHLVAIAVALPTDLPSESARALTKRSPIAQFCSFVQDYGFLAGLEIQDLAQNDIAWPLVRTAPVIYLGAIIAMESLITMLATLMHRPN